MISSQVYYKTPQQKSTSTSNSFQLSFKESTKIFSIKNSPLGFQETVFTYVGYLEILLVQCLVRCDNDEILLCYSDE